MVCHPESPITGRLRQKEGWHITSRTPCAGLSPHARGPLRGTSRSETCLLSAPGIIFLIHALHPMSLPEDLLGGELSSLLLPP